MFTRMNESTPRYRMLAGPVPAERVLPLFREAFGAEPAETARRTWAWKYEQIPGVASTGPRLFYTERGNEIVAFHGVLAGRIRVGDDVLPLVWGVDYASHPQHRGRGIALLRFFMEQQPDIVQLGTPVGRAYEFEKKMGCTDVCRLVNYKRVLRPRRVFAAKSQSRGKARLTALACAAADAALRLAAPRVGAGGLRVAPLTTIDARFDALWERVGPGYPVITVRDRAFLHWRFVACPHRAYTVVAAERNGTLAGYLAYRLDDDATTGIRYGHIVDLLAARRDRATLDSLLAWTVAHLRRERADLLTCSVTPLDTVHAALRRNGFWLTRPGLPVIVGETCAGRAAILAAREHYFTRADSDADLA